MKKCNVCGVKLSSWSTRTKYGPNGTLFCDSCYDIEDSKKVNQNIQEKIIVKVKEKKRKEKKMLFSHGYFQY